MKKCLVIIVSILMLINPVSAKDSAETNPNSISSSPDLEMYGQNIKGVNRVETDRVVLAGLPRSSSDAVSKGYVDNQISSLEGIIRSLQKIVSNQTTAINHVLAQQQVLNNRISQVNQQLTSLNGKVSSLSSRVASLEVRVSKLENKPAALPPKPSGCASTIISSQVGTYCGSHSEWRVVRDSNGCARLKCKRVSGK